MKNIFGIDIGGTKITGILFDGKKVLKELTIVTPKTKKDFEYSLKHLAAFLSAGMNVEGIGIGTAGVVDPKKNKIVHSPNLPYLDNFDFQKLFKNHSVKVDNDANCFTRAEYLVGAAKGHKNVVALTLGTGIGMGMVINGDIFRGSHHSGGEFGHAVADMKNFKDLEYFYQKAKDPKGSNHNIPALINMIGICLANAVNIFDPDMVVVGGTVGVKHYGQIIPGATRNAQKLLVNKKLKIKVTPAKVSHSGAIGAALQHGE